jgi:hypothetical protein
MIAIGGWERWDIMLQGLPKAIQREASRNEAVYTQAYILFLSGLVRATRYGKIVLL